MCLIRDLVSGIAISIYDNLYVVYASGVKCFMSAYVF
jgi:hypothetical protein